uniref:Synaptotagmin 6 n=1 Tax=Takifugu rubripes TaxID=31033 RepID=A0A674P6F8_TAKRU
MSPDREEYDMVCQRAVTLIVDLCLHNSTLLDQDTCQDYLLLLSSPSSHHQHPDATFGLLLAVFVVCGLTLLGLLAFVSWKLRVTSRQPAKSGCSGSSLGPERHPLQPPLPLLPSPQRPSVTMATEKVKDPVGSMGFLEAAVKISRTSPDIPTDVQLSMREHFLRRTQRMQRQTTEPASSTRHSSFKRHLPRQMQVGSLDLGNDYVLEKDETSTSIGRIQPELYQQKDLESEDSSKNGSSKNCGSINFSLQYDYENEALLVNVLKAVDLPAKDLCGTSDPYVKVYLLPDRKKFQTRVHRKTLNPTFSETFQFPVPYDELAARKLHMSVFDFDRFSRHDMIGEVVLENLFETSDLSRETTMWRDIQYATSESVDLGEIMFSLCYLPTAGRLTLTVIKCRNLKAMDITGYSDPYVKVSLMCDGRRLKKKKTSIKKNTLNPSYNEAIIFDIPPRQHGPRQPAHLRHGLRPGRPQRDHRGDEGGLPRRGTGPGPLERDAGLPTQAHRTLAPPAGAQEVGEGVEGQDSQF